MARTLLFLPCFVDAILANIKRHMIRLPRKRRVIRGELLSLRVWDGVPYRSSQREIRMVQCRDVLPIAIAWDNPRLPIAIWIGEHRLDAAAAERFARRDGFAGLAEMSAFWRRNEGPFKGILIRWNDLLRSPIHVEP